MKIYPYHFDETVQLINLGDLHFANRHCDRQAIARMIEYIRVRPQCYWYSTGDLLEAAVPGFPGWGDSDLTIDQEKNRLCDLLMPIREKCLGFVRSNHHRRVQKAAGLSLDTVIADKLNIPFFGATGIICATVGRAAYYIVIHHGVGGGRKDGGKINNLQEPFVVVPGADVYSLGHTHSFMHIKNLCYYLDKKRHSCVEMNVDFVYTGHYLDYADSYADDGMYRPKPKGSSSITLKHCETGNNSNKVVTIDLLLV